MPAQTAICRGGQAAGVPPSDRHACRAARDRGKGSREMPEPAQPKPRHGWSWKRTAWILSFLLILGIVAVIFLPELLPGAAVRRKVQKALAARLGRPVSIESAGFRWGEGLTITGLRVGQAVGSTAPLATARQLVIQFDPLEAVRSVAGYTMPLDSVHVSGLELWLAIDKNGVLNVADLGEGEPVKVRSLQIADAQVHIANEGVGRSLTLRSVNASLGELATTGHAYLSLSATLATPTPGRFSVTANLNRLDFTREEPLAGSLKAEWSDVAWPQLVSMFSADPPMADLLAGTSGRAAVTLGHGTWDAEGFVTATQVLLARQVLWARPETGPQKPRPDAVIPMVTVGFQLRQPSAAKPVDVSLIRVLAPGFAMKISGTVRLDKPSAADSKAAVGLAGLAILKEPDLQGMATVQWVQLCQSIAPLKEWVKQLELGGTAKLDARLTASAAGPHFAGSADLTDTHLVWPGVLEQRARQTVLVTVEGNLPGDLSAVDVARCDLITASGTASARGRLPLSAVARMVRPPAPGAAPAGNTDRPWAGAWLEARADIKYVEGLLNMSPALARCVAPLRVSGPLEMHVSCLPQEPEAAAAAPPPWEARLQISLTETHIEAPPRPSEPAEPGTAPAEPPKPAQKPAGTRAALEAVAVLTPDARSLDVRSVKINLAKSSLVWDGIARLSWSAEDWPRLVGSPPSAGRFSGTIALASPESAVALLWPGTFERAVPPLSGDAVFDVKAELVENRLRARLSAGLDKVAIHAGDYFVKPADQPASVVLTALWQTASPYAAEADLALELPAARLTAMGRGPLEFEWLHPAPAEGDAAAPASGIRVRSGPGTAVELRAKVSDVAKALGLSPALKAALKECKTEGSAEVGLLLGFGKTSLSVAGTVNLTDSLLDLGPWLNKPRGLPLTLTLAGDAALPQPQSVALKVASAEARLADSVTSFTGQVRLGLPGLAPGLTPQARLAALLEEADVEVHANWVHNADLRKALPWMDALYSRCGLEGPTQLVAAFSGTPTQGSVRLDADGTGCRILNAETLLKPAATPATLRLEVRYGQAPGEMILDRLAVKLADSAATFDGRFLFADPRFLTLAPPTAWSFHVSGQVPDAAILASLFPARLADLKPSGALSFDLRAGADHKATQVESCRLTFKKARIEWLGRPFLIDGPATYDGERLASEGLNLVAGTSDVTLTAYITGLNDDPSGSVILRGKNLDLKECEELLRQTTEHLSALTAPAESAPKGTARPRPERSLSDDLARRGQSLLARARLSAEVNLDRVTVVVPSWNTTYVLTGLAAEGRVADRRFVMPRFQCAMNSGTMGGEMAIDFREDVPVLSIAYDARDLKMADNLKPFIEATFPGMTVSGMVSTRQSTTQRLTEKSYPVGRGETILTDGLLEGPAAPDYITAILPGLKMTQYRFTRMSNDYEKKANGDTDNRMIFTGRGYDIYIFGVTRADGQIHYQAGIDLSVSLGSKVISRTIDSGKLPLLNYTGRISGSRFSEFYPQYVMPHEFAYDVFVRRNLLVELVRRLGETPPKIERPAVVPDLKSRTPPEG